MLKENKGIINTVFGMFDDFIFSKCRSFDPKWKYLGGYYVEFIEVFWYSRSVWFLIELYIGIILLAILKYAAVKIHINSYIIYMVSWIGLSILLPGEPLSFYKFKWLFPFMLFGVFCAEKQIKEHIYAERISLLLFLPLALILYDRAYFVAYASFAYQSSKEIFAGILYYGISLLGIIGAFSLSRWKKPTFSENGFAI